MKYQIMSIIMCLGFLQLKAQQEPMYTHYMFNTLAVNPAYAGTRDALTITGLHRSQWVGFDGAPVTQTLTMHAPITRNGLSGGLSFINDKIGPFKYFSMNIDVAYAINITEESKLSFGIKGSGNLIRNALDDLPLDQTGDAAFAQRQASDMLPNFGFGVYYYQAKWYAGISAPKLLENNFYKNTVSGSTKEALEKQHYYFIAGTVFDLVKGGLLELKPTTFVRLTAGVPAEVDLTALFIYEDKIEAGLMYRTGDALGLLLGYYATTQLRLGYSFDFSMTNTTFKYNGGSHELKVRYDFLYKRHTQKIRSPRYF